MRPPTSFPAERAILDLVLANGGGTYDCGTYGKAIKFRQRCYEFRKSLQKMEAIRDKLNLGDISTPYDPITISLEKPSSVLTFRIATPTGVFRTPDGRTIQPTAPTIENEFSSAAAEVAAKLRPRLATPPALNLDPDESS